MRSWLNKCGALIALIALFTSLISPAEATHLRGAVGSIVYSVSAKTVTITSTNVARKDACKDSAAVAAGGSLCTFFAFPSIVQINRTTAAKTTIKACTGQSTTPTSKIYDNTSQPLYNIFTTTYVIDVSCPTFSTSFDYIFSQLGMNRIGGIRNTTNQVIQFEGRIRIDGVTSRKAPVYNTGYMTNVAYDESPTAIFSTSLNATGQNSSGVDGYGVTYALVTSSTSGIGGYGATTLPCSNFNTSTGVLQIGVTFCSLAQYQAAYKGGTDVTPIYYAFKTIASDALGQYTTRDVLLSFSGTSNTAPTISRSASTNPVTLTAGASVQFTYTAGDTNTGDKLVFSSNTLPAWASVSTALGTLSSSNSQTLTLTLSPPSGTNYAGTIYISTTDNAAYPLSATNQLDISVGSAILPPGSPGRPTISTNTATFTAPTTGGTVVSYSAVATPITGSGNLTATTCASPGTSPLICTFASSVVNYTVVITATNTVGSANSLPSLAPASLYISNPALTWTQNVAPTTNYTLSQTGQPLLVYSIASSPSGTSLPTGLTFSTSTGLITGTPTATRTITTYVITGSTGGSSPITATVNFTLTVSAAASVSKISQTITFPKLGQFPKLTSTPTTPSTPDKPSSAFILQPLNAFSNSGIAITYSTTSSNCSIVQGTSTNTATYYLAYVRTSSTSTSTTTCTVKASAASSATYNSATLSIVVSVNRSAGDANGTYSAAPGMAAITYPGVATSVSLQTGTSLTTTGIPISQALVHNFSGTYSSRNGITTSQGWTDCSVSPTLPAGLTFGAFTCQLAGTPTAASASATYTVTYRNPSTASTSTKTFVMAVAKGNQTLTFPALSNMNTTTADQTPGATNSVSVANGGEAISYRTSNASICTIVDSKVHPVASGTCTVTASAGSNTNYNAAVDVTQSFTILGPPILSLANGYTNDITAPVGEYRASFFPMLNAGGAIASWSIKNEGGTVLTASTIPKDLVFNTTTGVLSGSFEESQARTGYYIVATNAAGSNEFHVYMTATKVDQSITFNALNGMVVGNSDQNLFALATSGLPVSFATDNASVCTIVSAKVHAVAAGICTVTASQTANAGADPTYNAATSVDRQFSISAALTPPEIYLSNTSATVSINQPLPWLFDVMNSGGAVGASGFTISPLPSTISATPTVITFDATYGVFTGGTPNQVGTTVFTITANNSATPGGVGASIATFTLNVVAAPDTMQITQIGEMLAGANASADATIVATTVSGRTPITYTASPSNVCSLVSGKLHPIGYGTCVLSGHLNADSVWSSADASINISIHAPPTLTLTTPVILTGGAVYSRSVITQNYVGDPATKYELWDSTGTTTNYTNIGLWSLIFNSSTGALTGTATSINQAAKTFMLKVTNPYGTANASVTISIAGLTAPVISISNVDLTAYSKDYEFQDDFIITNTGQAATDYLLYATGTTTPATLPAGLSFDTSAGVIYGTATTATTMAKTSYDFYAHNAAGNSNKIVVSLTLVNPVTITTSTTIPTASLPVAGSPFSFPLVGSGGFGTYVWTYANNSSWLTVDSSGNLVGTPPANGSGNTFTIDITLTDSGTPGMGGPSFNTTAVTYSGKIAANTASTDAATNITQNSATLNGSSGLSGAFSGGFFCYSTSQPGTSPNFAFTPNYSAKTCTSATTATTSQTSSPFTANITSLSANTTYYMQFFVVNAATNRAGTLKSFKTYNSSYSVTGTAGANGSISPSGATTTNYGETPTYTITPSANYHIASVLVDGMPVSTTGTPATYTFAAINAAHTIDVTFAADVYKVTFNFDSASTGSPSFSSFDYVYGAAAFTLPTTGSLLRDNYTFIGWNTASAQSVTNVTSPYTPTTSVTLYAAWTPNYSINFDKGTGESGSLASVSGSGNSVTLPAFSTGDITKNGYHFNNWLSDDGTTSYANSATISLSAAFTHTLTAQWTADTYLVTYDPNSGSVSPTSISYTVGNSGLTLPTPTRAGYTFTGWFTPDSVKVLTPYIPMAAITLTAQWSLKSYTITYKPGAGATGSDIIQTLAHFDSVTIYDNLATTTNYSYAGKYFNGWKNVSGNAVLVGSSYATYADMVLTAQWANVLKYKVTYNPNATDVVGSVPVDPNEYAPGETATVVAPTISRPGYSFLGWNTNKFGTGTTIKPPGTSLMAGPMPATSKPLNKGSLNSVGPSTLFKSLKTAPTGPIDLPRSKNVDPTLPVNGNVVLYAMWGPLSYTVTYAANSGTVSPATSSFVSGSAPINLPTPTRDGYSFNGWYSPVPALVGLAGAEYTPTTDITLTAGWTANTYLINYDPNGGTVGTTSATYTFGGTALTLPTPTFAGRTFAGWSTAASGGSAVTSPYSPSAAGTIYATWTLNSYTVTYNANGGTVGTASEAWNYGDAELVLPTPTRALYTCTGWYTASTGGSLVGAAGAGYTPASSSTIYAQWSVSTYAYSISFNRGTGESGSLASVNGTANQVTLPLFSTGDMAKTGSTFDGWLSDDGTTIYADGQTISLTSAVNLTLTARWAGAVYNYAVTFNKGTGDSGTLATKTGTGSSFTLPAFSTGNMVKAGYHFVNWLSDDASTFANSVNITITADYTHTFTAQWEADSFVVTYNPGSGSVTPTTANFTTGNTALVLPTPIYAGFTFNGWYSASSGGTSIGSAGANYTPTTTVTVYAQWSSNTAPPADPGPTTPSAPAPAVVTLYTVTYMANSATSGAVPIELATYINGASVVSKINSGLLAKPDYSFVGWNTKEDGTGITYPADGLTSIVVSGENIVLYAKWALVNKFTVTYNGNLNAAGIVPVDTDSYATGATFTVKPDSGQLSKATAIFIGWNTKANGTGITYAPGASVVMGKTSVTLYALWKRVSTHKIWLYPNGATSGTVPSITDRYKEGDIAQIPLNSGKLQKTGFVFVGWNTFTDGSGTSYPAGGAFKVGKVNLMLFAMWAKDTAPSATDGKVNFEVFYAMNSYFLDAKARTLIEAKVAAVKKKLSPSSEITIRIVGWVQPTKVSPNVQFLSTNRAQIVAKYMKDLGFKGTYILKYPGHDKDNLPSSRHATIEITFTK